MAQPTPPPGFVPVASDTPPPPAGFVPMQGRSFAAPGMKKQDLSWLDVPGQAAQNLPKSALEFGKAVVQPIIHPIDTATAFKDLAVGLVSKLGGAVGVEQDPKRKAQREAVADAVGKHFADRYGSMDGLKQAIASDPVGVMGDVSMILTGGGAAAARAPGMIGRAGEIARSAGSTIDPVMNTARAARATAGGIGTAITNTLGVTTGAGTRPLQEAYAAGRAGNQAFTDNMRGMAPIDNVVDMAEAAVGQMGRDRSAAYNANMAATRASQQMIDFQPIRDALDRARDFAVYTSPSGQTILRNQEALQTHTLMTQLVNDFMSLPPVERTPQALDSLKRSLKDIQQATRQGSEARGAADVVHNAARNEIVTQVPNYADAMRDYAQASDNIGEMRRTLSINDRASTDTTLRKLQSTMRNNVNANFGQREALLDNLAQYQPNLPPALAGQTLNSWAPRGLMRGAAGGVGLYGVMTANPTALAAAPFTSPRLMGEMMYGAGRGSQMMEDAANLLNFTPENVARTALTGYAAGMPSNLLTDKQDKDGFVVRVPIGGR